MILDKVEILGSTNEVAANAATTSWYSSPFDTVDCEGVLFVLAGTTAWTGGSTGKVGKYIVSGSCSSGGTYVAMRGMMSTGASTGAGMAFYTSDVGTEGGDKKRLAIDVTNPSKRWLKLGIHNSSDSVTITAIKYDLKNSGSTESKDSTTLMGTTAMLGAAT